MADEKVTVEFAHHHRDHVPGDRVELPVDEARALVDGGFANYATKTDAKHAEPDGGADKTAAARKNPTD